MNHFSFYDQMEMQFAAQQTRVCYSRVTNGKFIILNHKQLDY